MNAKIGRIGFLALAASAVAAFGGDSLQSPVSSDASDAVRVATYNIRLATGDNGTPNAWAERCDDMADLIRRLNVDVGGLQEVRPEQMSFLREKFPEFEFVGEHRGADRVSDVRFL